MTLLRLKLKNRIRTRELKTNPKMNIILISSRQDQVHLFPQMLLRLKKAAADHQGKIRRQIPSKVFLIRQILNLVLTFHALIEIHKMFMKAVNKFTQIQNSNNNHRELL